MWKKIVFTIFLVCVFIITAAATYFYSTYNRIIVKPWGKQPTPTPTSSPIPDVFNQGRTQTTLLMGYGGGGHQGGLLTDTMMLAIIDPPTKTITLFSLPRDLWVELPVNGDQLSGWKINAAYAIGSDDRGYRHKPIEYTGPAGGGQLAKFAVKQATGLEVDKFVTINFSGFRKSIDVLGGVDVSVEKTFNDPLYPIEGKEDDPCGKTAEELQVYATMSASVAEKDFPCRYENLHFDKGMTHMDGQTALKYVRSRHSLQDGTDFGRAARQRNLLIAVKDRVFRLDFFPKIIPFINSLSEDLKTDYDINTMQEVLKYRQDLGNYKITTMALSEDNVLKLGRSPNGQSIVMPREGIDKWDTIHTWIQEELQKLRHPELATPSATATSSAQPVTQQK